MISVIVPVYNAEKCLHRCIDSILAQSYTDFELLLIDDGSTDSSGAICDVYSLEDRRVRVFHKENGGVSSARNLGLELAEGEYITFCDADDYVSSDWLAVYEDAVAEGVDLVIQGFYTIDANGTLAEKLLDIDQSDKTGKRGLIISLTRLVVFGYLWVKLFRKDIIKKNNVCFDEKSTFWEDEQFVSRYMEFISNYRCIREANYYYYLPAQGKDYKAVMEYTSFCIFKSLDNIYDNDVPLILYSKYGVFVKNHILELYYENRKLSSYERNLYKRILDIQNKEMGIKETVFNYIFLRSHKLKGISYFILSSFRFFNKIFFNKECK